jgi:triacylglycerol lipase
MTMRLLHTFPPVIALSLLPLVMTGCSEAGVGSGGIAYDSSVFPPDDAGDDASNVDDGSHPALNDGAIADTAAPDDTSTTDGAVADGGTQPDAETEIDAAIPKLGPPYPIVLAHGLFGFRDLAGVGLIYYFNGVPAHLEARGEVVYTTEVDPFNDSAVRGAALAAQIEAILEEDPHEKVIVIGHSQGGIDARVAASLRPDLIDAVVTYATPHRGTRVADLGAGALSIPLLGDIAGELLDTLLGAFTFIWPAASDQSSLVASVMMMTTAGMAEFNELYPDDPSVSYYSVTGRTDWHKGGASCEAPGRPFAVTRWDSEQDPVDPLLDLLEVVLDEAYLVEHVLKPLFYWEDGEANDALVAAKSARWGRFLGCVPADHLDQVGHLLGDSPGFGNGFNHLTFFADLVAFLHAEGH